ncbi:hypothetical protein SAMD00019534_028860 [Acytostelium subglobosum LB1]|uniref:hypothetical protein n=1 Tax=Acytostelium subglobosum LB1 TaxID=1410327 RepID=UPI000644E982|nr:hypothetical protein SAMD00019534_028860 [Acytostelium subglobosum LB1]GAM19711.1 hypothetical protein SAMD00019534_028860 [Acytostelium subglobosum LB1]|eukprot:XP_012756473.1 hypothetical protein SAMD00019534_028860 [Acytostelium subglobosum LB1]
MDDENEWITLASTEDLKEANSISPSLLKILVVKCDEPGSKTPSSMGQVDVDTQQQQHPSQTSQHHQLPQQQQNNKYIKNNQKNNDFIEDIAMNILSNDRLMETINSILSQSLADNLPSIINSTIPYTIPILVSTISNLKKNESEPSSHSSGLSNKEKRFSCSAEEKYLEPSAKTSTATPSSFITSPNATSSTNSHTSILSQSLPVYTINNNPIVLSPPMQSNDSSPLKDSTQELAPPPQPVDAPLVQVTTSLPSRKSSSPIPFFFSRTATERSSSIRIQCAKPCQY